MARPSVAGYLTCQLPTLDASRKIPLDSSIRADHDWWLAFCYVFNGRACIIKDLHPIPIVSDSSFMGFGAWAGLDWITGFWNASDCPQGFTSGCGHVTDPPAFDKCGRNINVCELWPVVAGLHRWAPRYRNSRNHIITDNMQVLAMVNTGRSANKTCMTWLRELFWVYIVNNITLFATYIKSADNILADSLSRAAYPGVAEKCKDLLYQFNMCLSGRTFRKLKSRQQALQGAAWAASTRLARRSQIQCYKCFCALFSLREFPCDAMQACLYASFFCDFMSHASIANYLSALWTHHRLLGLPTQQDDFRLHQTLRGICRLGRPGREPRHPLSLEYLHAVFTRVNTYIPSDLMFWSALTLAFRALLRKSHYTASPHTLFWKNISLYPDHLVLTIPSSKSNQFGVRPHRVVLNSSPHSFLCPVRWLNELIRVQRP